MLRVLHALPLPPEIVGLVVAEKRRMDLARGAARLADFERSVWRLTAAMKETSSDFESALDYYRYVKHWHHEASGENGRARRRVVRLLKRKEHLGARGRRYGCLPNCLCGLDEVYIRHVRGSVAWRADAARHRAGKLSLLHD